MIKWYKEVLSEICREFDHKFIFEIGSINDNIKNELAILNFDLKEVFFRPTAEEFAHYFYRRLFERDINVNKVEIYETPNNCAVYEE